MTTETGNTRQRILDAAYRILLEQGYEAASMRAIAQAAGVNLGLIHYHFQSKEQLLVAVLQRVTERVGRAVKEVRQATASEELGQVILQFLKNQVRHRPEDYRLYYDFYALGLRHNELLPEVRILLQEQRAGTATTLAILAPAKHVNIEALAAVLSASFNGLALQYLLDAQFDLDAAYHELAQMVLPYLQSS